MVPMGMDRIWVRTLLGSRVLFLFHPSSPFQLMDSMKVEKPEYSDDFNFFIANQVFTATSSNGRLSKICSRLESRVLGTINLMTILDSKKVDAMILEKCKEIHENLILNKETVSLTS